MSNIKLPIYLDYQATTPLDERVFDIMLPYLKEKFGNPHSRSHVFGWEAEDAVEKARIQVASLINANPRDITFTSGATESNNLAIKGCAYFNQSKGKNHIITLSTEHKCVLNACRKLKLKGFDVTYLPVEKNGIVDLEKLRNAITNQTILVSIMAVNNEIGVIQPLKEIGQICREKGVFFHSDIAQAYGKIPIDVEACNIDLASISSHKIYGPKGVGALYVRRKPRVRLEPIIDGGGQERGLRSGTLAPHLIVGFGAAAEIAKNEMQIEFKRIKELSSLFLKKIFDNLDEVYLNGDKEKRYAGNLNISFSCVEGESLIVGIKVLAVSSGSACTSSSLEPSYVLKALGVDEEMAHTSIRIGIGRFTTREEVEYAANLIIEKVKHLRDLSPLWEMKLNGIDLKQVNWSAH